MVGPLFTSLPAAGLALAVLLPLSLAPDNAQAVDAEAANIAVTSDSVADRINLAGRQRSLTLSMAKSFCYARSGVDAARNVKALQDDMSRFDAVLDGFAKGDATLGLFAEQDAGVKKAWNSVNLMWTPLSAIYVSALDGAFVSEEEFGQAMGLTLEVRKRSNDMVAQLRAAYADELGDGGFGDAVLIDLYGRQRSLSQQLSKLVCLMSRGFEPTATQSELVEALDLFETSLNAFLEGMPIAGVPKPPSQEIAD
ncbi:MAG: type IV pili methyl-accepting chemotaxis transducer N-terminal domain-containing protein [Pseudomonadota bacterium]